MRKKSKPYKDFLFERLQNSEEAAAYLNAALEDGDLSVFLLALRDIAQAHGGMSQISKEAHLNREALYRMLSRKGNPTLISLRTILGVYGLKLSVHPNC